MTASHTFVTNLKLWLSLMDERCLAEVVQATRNELQGRLKLDAANYLTRAVACLDIERVAPRG